MSANILTETQLGHLLQGYRKARGMNQTQLAQRAGISQARLSALESHPGRITVAQLLRLTAALGLDLRIDESPPETAHRVADSAAPEW
jgi:HTH-type transcriptional regulator/antitoxin HipB